MPHRIATALSGGVDSLMAAILLKEKGHEVLGIHFINGYDTSVGPDDIRRLAADIGIPVEILDIRDRFREIVVDYFTRTYQMGKTPNPCLVCNPRIKFGIILEAAQNLGAAYLATGHYARTGLDANGQCRLFKGTDPHKDQSYFLAFLSSAQLSRAWFPLGQLTKDQVRQMTADRGLVPAARQESQDVCFIKGQTYGAFLKAQKGFSCAPGPIETADGRVIGEHQGLHLFTVGQRKGINCPAAAPYYVLRLDPARNRLVVGFKEELTAGECLVEEINWIRPPPGPRFTAQTRIRYRHGAARSVIHVLDPRNARVCFDTPQDAVTPGQGAVFYQGDEVLGAGVIT